MMEELILKLINAFARLPDSYSEFLETLSLEELDFLLEITNKHLLEMKAASPKKAMEPKPEVVEDVEETAINRLMRTILLFNDKKLYFSNKEKFSETQRRYLEEKLNL